MQPFKPFDHKKLEINDSIIKIDIKKKRKLINDVIILDNMIDKNDNNIYKINDNIIYQKTILEIEKIIKKYYIIMIQLLTIRIMFHLIKIKME